MDITAALDEAYAREILLSRPDGVVVQYGIVRIDLRAITPDVAGKIVLCFGARRKNMGSDEARIAAVSAAGAAGILIINDVGFNEVVIGRIFDILQIHQIPCVG
jgi:hypothetical protein